MIMRRRYSAEYWTGIVRRIRIAVSYGLRITHIALWMTIPTAFWFWLGSPPPLECVPQYGWYKGNALCVSEDAHLWITLGLFLLGFAAIACWLQAYSLAIVDRALQGEKQLPPLRMMSAIEGLGLFFMSLKFWLPAIAYLIVITVLASTLPLATRNHSYHALLMFGAPIMLLMYWGYLVGLARFAAFGEYRLLYRRRENMRLALTNIRATILLSLLLSVTTIGAAAILAALEFLALPLRDLDFMIWAALSWFAFFFVLLWVAITFSRHVADYARKIGIGDNLRTDAKLA